MKHMIECSQLNTEHCVRAWEYFDRILLQSIIAQGQSHELNMLIETTLYPNIVGKKSLMWDTQ